MKKLTLLFACIIYLINNINAQTIQPIPSNVNLFNSISKERPAEFEYLSAPDYKGERIILKSPSAKSDRSQQLKLPYPIIFIHGLGSKSATWDSTTNFMDSHFGLTFGGRFDFCLNSDSNNTTANKFFYPAPSADITLFNSNLTAGDYYYVNFGVGSDGSVYPLSSDPHYVTSEQQAIVKQAAALARSIHDVLQITGRDKVILMGHSIGGLASREYLQNPVYWQPDGAHHVAKLATTGTPHGGSGSTSYGLPVSGVDEQSEAIRDLRTTYHNSNDSGVFIFGGLELQDNIAHKDDNNNISGFDFYNVDVNCNGVTGENIIGLNKKSIPIDLDYSCIVGKCLGCIVGTPGDGVVLENSAELENFYNLSVNPVFNLFYYNASAFIQIHTNLPMQNYQNMQALDEPNEYELAYHIDLDTAYTGFITVQPAGGYSYDYDDYKFSVSSNSIIYVSVNNIELNDLMAKIVDSAGNTVGSVVHSSGSANINFTQAVSAGDYYFQIYGTPATTSYLHPYSFTLTKTGVGVGQIEKKSDILIYPNPASNSLNISNIAGKTNIKLIDVLGGIVMETVGEGSITIDTSQLDGVYTLITNSSRGRKISRIIITK